MTDAETPKNERELHSVLSMKLTNLLEREVTQEQVRKNLNERVLLLDPDKKTIKNEQLEGLLKNFGLNDGQKQSVREDLVKRGYDFSEGKKIPSQEPALAGETETLRRKRAIKVRIVGAITGVLILSLLYMLLLRRNEHVTNNNTDVRNNGPVASFKPAAPIVAPVPTPAPIDISNFATHDEVAKVDNRVTRVKEDLVYPIAKKVADLDSREAKDVKALQATKPTAPRVHLPPTPRDTQKVGRLPLTKEEQEIYLRK